MHKPNARQPASPPAPARPLAAVILAAGRSKRMKSDLVKVLHPVCDRPMVAWVVDACRAAGCSRIILVVGFQGDRVQSAFEGQPDVEFAEQAQPLGTGHAVMQTEPLLESFGGDVVVLAGDGPLIRAETLEQLVAQHREKSAAATLATARIPDPAGYGRIVRDASGQFARIVEDKDATPDEKRIDEINPSYYCFDVARLFAALRRLTNENASGEYYLTDVCSILLHDGLPVEVIDAVRPDEVHSINTSEQLEFVSSILAKRLAEGAVH